MRLSAATDDGRERWWPYLLVIVVWLLTRLYPVLQTEPSHHWEIWESKKLLQYGFQARLGGILNWHQMTGWVPDPSQFNYVNHPYPILWLNTLAYGMAGAWGAELMNLTFNLAGCLATLAVFRQWFRPETSLWGALLYTLAPSSILLSTNPNTVAVSALAWPMLFWLLNRGLATGKHSFALGLAVAVFLVGQISWFAYAIFATLALLLGWMSWKPIEGATSPDKVYIHKLRAMLLIGWAITILVFVGQILFYTPDWGSLFAYFRQQAGTEQGVPLARMCLTIVLRSALSVGPALLLGTVLSLTALNSSSHWSIKVSLLYLAGFAAAALLLPRFFYREISMYQHLVFPLALLTTSALQSQRWKSFTGVILGLGCLSLAYPMIRASIPEVSMTSMALGKSLQQISQPHEVIATNLRSQRPPFQDWDVSSTDTTAQIADRLLRAGIDSKQQLEWVLDDFRTNQLEIVYVLSPTSTIDSALKELLKQSNSQAALHFTVPEEPQLFATRWRGFYWKLSGKHLVSNPAPTSSSLDLQIYRFQLKRPQPGPSRQPNE